MSQVRKKLETWVEQNPDAYLKKIYTDIAAEAGVSPSSCARVLPEVIARRNGCLPSEVIKKRAENGLSNIGRWSSLTPCQIKEIHKLDAENMEHIDIAYLVGCSPGMVKKCLNK